MLRLQCPRFATGFNALLSKEDGYGSEKRAKRIICLGAFVCRNSIGSCICLKGWVLPLIASLFKREQSCNKETECIEPLGKEPHLL